MKEWVRPIGRGWVVRDEVPGPDVDEFAEPDAVVKALAHNESSGSLLAVQHPHRMPDALARGLDLLAALPSARASLAALLQEAYEQVTDVVAPYTVDGPDGSACGLLCLVDPAAVDRHGVRRIRHGEEVYPNVVAERAAMLAGLGAATSAAMLVPVADGDALTSAVSAWTAAAGDPRVSTVDSAGRVHRLWLLGPGPDRDRLLAVAGSRPLMVADGNHRVAAATEAGVPGLLALVTAGPRLRVGAFHRVLTGTGLTADDLAGAWRAAGMRVHDLDHLADGAFADSGPPGANSVVVHAGDRRLGVVLPPPEPGEPAPRIAQAVVENLLLRQALRIDPEGPLVRTLAEGRSVPPDADAVLLLAPVPLADVLAVHAAGGRMPRKSTYFTPKPRSGLLIVDVGGV
ncbi:uncharacterized protein (DUF1015 family) [Herbihabitans rhizosphaerae]|uniref:Uncharacterized protein (DUF1015 family) n=1 Tax=Herbihabitans rhizosphaerae TaxID=1872711 RepID=A0A4Q7KBH0_9PSEU|nr:DUF1015 family protein [Herbihabitans rhizosphaerae]RZS29552.1 uncharacterized protein (DUF1015 family) [Herbihabitans rhizosphaerae]